MTDVILEVYFWNILYSQICFLSTSGITFWKNLIPSVTCVSIIVSAFCPDPLFPTQTCWLDTWMLPKWCLSKKLILWANSNRYQGLLSKILWLEWLYCTWFSWYFCDPPILIRTWIWKDTALIEYWPGAL